MNNEAIRIPPPSNPEEREALLERARKARQEEEQHKEETIQQAREILEERKILQEILKSLSQARVDRNISLEDLAEKTGIMLEELSHYETSINAHPEFHKLQKIAKAIGVEFEITVK